MRLCFVEDDAVADLGPLMLTRSASDLLLECRSVGDQACRVFDINSRNASLDVIARNSLAAVATSRNPKVAVNDRAWMADGPSFTRIEGSCFVGLDTQLFSANLRGGVSPGPNCRIGGEVEEAIVQGHSNKYHAGFLGHAYAGGCVNLDAITSHSDLRNHHGEVFIPLNGDSGSTGRSRVGCFLGDQTWTGMGPEPLLFGILRADPLGARAGIPVESRSLRRPLGGRGESLKCEGAQP